MLLGKKESCRVFNKDESVAQIVSSSKANSQPVFLVPFLLFLLLTPPSECSLFSLKVHIVPPSKEF